MRLIKSYGGMPTPQLLIKPNGSVGSFGIPAKVAGSLMLPAWIAVSYL